MCIRSLLRVYHQIRTISAVKCRYKRDRLLSSTP